jgi:hypothetical protein
MKDSGIVSNGNREPFKNVNLNVNMYRSGQKTDSVNCNQQT